MIRNLTRSQIGLILFALPIVILLGWWLIGRIWGAAVRAPRWTISAGNELAARCDAAADLFAFDTEPVADTSSARITADAAQDIADAVILKYVGTRPETYLTGGPGLVRATFPDGQEHTAWYRVVVLDDGGGSLLGEAVVLYLDAQTAEPLLLVTDVTIGDPLMVCDFDLPRVMQQSAARTLPLILLTVYLLIAGLVAAVLWVRRRRAESAPPSEDGIEP